MKKMTWVSTVAMVLFLFTLSTSPAIADLVVYDDFNGTSIDSAKWSAGTLYGAPVTSVSSGALHFSGTGSSTYPMNESWFTKKNPTFPAYDGGGISYANFSASNGGQMAQANALFAWIGTITSQNVGLDKYYVSRYQQTLNNVENNGISVMHEYGPDRDHLTRVTLFAMLTTGTSGGLYVAYNNGQMMLGCGDPQNPQWLYGATVAFPTTPLIGFGAQSGTSNSTLSVDVEKYYLHSSPSAVPIPAAVWLLGSGFLGLLGLRRKFSKQ